MTYNNDKFKKLIGTNVYICTKTNRRYVARIKEVDNNILVIEDKYGDIVYINIDDLSVLEEEKTHGHYRNV